MLAAFHQNAGALYRWSYKPCAATAPVFDFLLQVRLSLVAFGYIPRWNILVRKFCQARCAVEELEYALGRLHVGLFSSMSELPPKIRTTG